MVILIKNHISSFDILSIVYWINHFFVIFNSYCINFFFFDKLNDNIYDKSVDDKEKTDNVVAKHLDNQDLHLYAKEMGDNVIEIAQNGV